ncbi:hypothetical protein GCM10010469_27130 [Streptomyces labedae]|uniref:Uncharacterized protein n=1 Tax=Streptomyces labedae TaxID=285569 RepID=A0ABP6QW36_9ACTN
MSQAPCAPPVGSVPGPTRPYAGCGASVRRFRRIRVAVSARIRVAGSTRIRVAGSTRIRTGRASRALEGRMNRAPWAERARGRREPDEPATVGRTNRATVGQTNRPP